MSNLIAITVDFNEAACAYIDRAFQSGKNVLVRRHQVGVPINVFGLKLSMLISVCML